MKHLIKYLLLISGYILSFCSIYGQKEPLSFQGIVLDATTKVGIPLVHIENLGTGAGTITNDNGKFSLPLTGFPARIVFHHVAYFSDTLAITDRKDFNRYYAKNETLFFLRTNVFLIGEVSVSAGATKLFDEEPYAIVDYQFLKHRIIAIGYRNYNEFKKEVLVADLNGKVIYSKPSQEVRELYKDCLGDIYLVDQDSAHQITIIGDSLVKKSSCEIGFFNDYVRAIELVLDSGTIYSQTSEEKQFIKYYMIRNHKKEPEFLYQVGNEQKEWNFGVMNKIISQELRRTIQESFIAIDELRAIYHRVFNYELDKMTQYKPVYSVLHEFGDNLLLFDFANYTIVRFTKEGKQDGITPMRIIFNNDWEQRMYHDPSNGRLYLGFLNIQLSYLLSLIHI